MAKRKSSGDGVAIVGLIILAALAKSWPLFVAIGVAALIIWLIARILNSQSQPHSNAANNSSPALLNLTRTEKLPAPKGQTSASKTKLCPRCAGELVTKNIGELDFFKCAACNLSFPKHPEQLRVTKGKSNTPITTFETKVATNSQLSSSSTPQSPSSDYRLAGASARQVAAISPDAFWIPHGRTFLCAGYSIPDGLIYFGSDLKSIQEWGEEPSLVDPGLPIDKDNPDHEGRNMSYWPAYSRIHPASRAAFLEWLSGGRKDPRIHIGYVFLYFYGLERRALSDAKDSTTARKELPTIIMEIKRLISIYGKNGSFCGYAGTLLDVLQVTQATAPLYRTPPQFEYSSYEVPLALKLALGQMAMDSVPLSADWALAWAENDPSMPRRMPVHRCKEEFRELFKIRYSDKFEEGLKLKPNKTRIRAMYHPASSSFGGQVEIQIPDLPDLTAITGPSSKINDLVTACTDELEGYSRFLGRNPDGKNSIEASSYLPQPLLEKHAGNEFQQLYSWLKATITSETSEAVSFSALLQHVPSMTRDGVGKKEATAIANLLGKMRVGIEPDPRFVTFLPKVGQDIVLFKVSDKAPNSPSAEYSAATVVLHLASAVAGADGSVEAEEERYLEKQLETWLHLSDDEKTRLRAHTLWLLSSCPGMSGVKKRLDLLKQDQRESLGRFLVGIAQTDGYIDPTEMKTLTKIYSMLNLDTQMLCSHAHAASCEPVTVQTADFVRSQGYVIPPPPLKSSEGISLDMGVVEAKLVETVAVSAILNNIFSEEEPVSTQGAIPVQRTSELSVVWLDSESYVFMKILASKLIWTREELEKLAAEHGMMLDGTLDSINDASFDHFGGPFFEGDDPIEINVEFAKEISP